MHIKILKKYISVIISIFILLLVLFIDNITTIPNILDTKFMDLNKALDSNVKQLYYNDNASLKMSSDKISDDIWIIGIDNNSLDKIGKWPFSRSIHGKFLDNITSIKNQQERESAVFIDIFFNENDNNTKEDVLLSEKISINNNVFLETLLEVFPLDKELSKSMNNRFQILEKKYGTIKNMNEGWQDFPRYYDQMPPISVLASQIKGYGHANLEPDVDDIYRRQYLVSRVLKFIKYYSYEEYISNKIPKLNKYEHLEWIDDDGERIQLLDSELPEGKSLYKYKNIFIPSITLSIALKYLEKNFDDVNVTPGKNIIIKNGISEIKIPINKKGAMLINYMGPRSSSSKRGYQTFPVRSYATYINAAHGLKTLGLKNKILLVGPFSSGIADDEKNTPEGMMYGVEIHANALNTILKQNFIYTISPTIKLFILIILSITIAIILSKNAVFNNTLVILISSFVYLIIINFFLSKFNIILPAVTPLMLFFLNYFGVLIFRLFTEGREKTHLKKTFGKYVNPSIVEQLVHSTPELGGTKKELTIFFSDIRGFTTMSEKMDSEELINHLNEYLTEMTDIILSMDGTLDKYVGDEIMCFWGAPLAQPDHAIKACKAALKMSKQLKIFNTKYPEKKQIKIGMGIHTGTVSVGNVGSKGRLSYTIIGDDVNLASRLEGTNKLYNTEILISKATYEIVKNDFEAREIGEVTVKGRVQPVIIYELLGIKEKT